MEEIFVRRILSCGTPKRCAFQDKMELAVEVAEELNCCLEDLAVSRVDRETAKMLGRYVYHFWRSRGWRRENYVVFGRRLKRWVKDRLFSELNFVSEIGGNEED